MPTITTLAVVPLLLLSHILSPVRGEKDFAFRIELFEAVVAETDDLIEQQTLVRTAVFESNLSRDIARCECPKGMCDGGTSKGTFQVKPMSKDDAVNACGDARAQTRLALSYMRRSAESCGVSLATSAKSMHRYVSGLCELDGRAHEMAVHRWGGTPLQTLAPAGK